MPISRPTNVMHLSSLRVGESGRIIKYVEGSKNYRQKLLSMGLLPGTEFKLSRIAPLGDPLEIQVRGFSLSLRKMEANILLVEKVDL